MNRDTPPYTFRRGANPRSRGLAPSVFRFFDSPRRVLSPSLSELLFWSATAVCAVAQVAVVRAALAGRTPGASPALLARTREFFWVLLPAALLALLLVWTWRSLPARFNPSQGATASHVEGHPIPEGVRA